MEESRESADMAVKKQTLVNAGRAAATAFAACPGGFDDFQVDDKDRKRPEARTDGSMTIRSPLREILETIERLEAKGLVSHDELMEVKPMLERSIKMNEKDTAMEDTTNSIYEMICARIDKNFEDLRSFVETKRNESA